MAPWVLSVMRIAVAFMFLSVGTMKMFDLDPFTQIGLAAIIEEFGGTLVLLGLATRPVAFIMSGEMAVAYFQVYAPQAFFPMVTGSHPADLFCWISLDLVFAAPNPGGLDALIADASARRGVEATVTSPEPSMHECCRRLCELDRQDGQPCKDFSPIRLFDHSLQPQDAFPRPPREVAPWRLPLPSRTVSEPRDVGGGPASLDWRTLR